MFITRLISSIILVAAALLTIICGGYILAVTLLLVSLAAYRELMRACRVTMCQAELNTSKSMSRGLRGVSKLEVIGWMTILAYYGVMVFSGNGMLLLLTLILALAAFMSVYVFWYPEYHADQIMKSFFCVIYAPVMLSCIYLTRELTHGLYVVWLIFISSWICDTSAYLVGILLGKHRLAPRLSPKKSVEGAVGGIMGAIFVGALYGYFVMNRLMPGQRMVVIFATIGGIGAVISQIGDLAASAIKRNHDIKDYGQSIPGHGGVMDRFDSVIFTAPMIYLLAVLFI